MAEPLISVCIVTGRRLAMLDACLESLQAQVDPPVFELLVCSDGDHEVAEAVYARFPDAKVCLVRKALPGAARNLLIERARGELLLFLDDDVTVEPGMMAHLAGLARAHRDAAVFGGPNETPPRSSRFQIVQGAVLASMVGSGPVRRRYGSHPAGDADERYFILCNLAVRRAAMLPFSDELVCAEENDVLSKMSRAGLRMFYDPTLIVYHERRPTPRGFAQQMFKYGRGRGQLLRRDPKTFRPSYAAPVALVAGVPMAIGFAVTVSPWWWVPAGLYVLGIGASGARVARTLKRARHAPLAAALTAVLHVCYGTGIARGVLERTTRRRTLAPLEPEWLEPAPQHLR